MRGAPVRAIQELAGHADLSTTMRYMHLSPASLNQAIRLLEQRPPLRGENGESWHPSAGKHEQFPLERCVPTEIRTVPSQLITTPRRRTPKPNSRGNPRARTSRTSRHSLTGAFWICPGWGRDRGENRRASRADVAGAAPNRRRTRTRGVGHEFTHSVPRVPLAVDAARPIRPLEMCPARVERLGCRRVERQNEAPVRRETFQLGGETLVLR